MIDDAARCERTGAEVPAELSLADRHRVLADPRRVRVLRVLDPARVPYTLETLAAVLSRTGGDGADLDPRDVAADLHHRHLPMLADLGLIEYDHLTNTVRECHGAVEGFTD